MATGRADYTTKADVNIENASLDVDATGSSIDANITNADIPISHVGDLDVNVTNATISVDASGATVPISAAADLNVNVTNATIPITHTGDLDVNITNATLDISGSTVSFPAAQDVNISSTTGDLNCVITNASIPITHVGDLDVNITNADLTVSGDITGTVAISGTPTVQFAAAQSVNIGTAPTLTVEFSGTQDVNITTGSVDATIQNASIDVAQIATADIFSIGQYTVTTNATQLLGSPAGRLAFIMVNNSDQTVYIGPYNTVTTATGLPIAPGASYSNDVWKGTLYGRVAAGTSNVRLQEFNVS